VSDKEFILNQLDVDENDALAYATAMQKTASAIGFDWPEINGVIEKLEEELAELKHEISESADKTKQQAELGDLLFACCNLARHLGINPAEALQNCNRKFYRRFNYVETRASVEGKQFSDYSLDELDNFWDEAKQLEKLDQEGD
jgi:uncharacterized protein YabN with tetrapyrrole methylase and pyrophosphatase domain